MRIKTKQGWHVFRNLGADPYFFFTTGHETRKSRSVRVPKVYPVFPDIEPHEHHGLQYRLACMDDLDLIIEFVDRLLAGRDFFCPRGQHISYFKYKTIVVTYDASKLIGWAVRQRMGSLIHLLVDTDYRGKGIGSHLLELLEPLTIRSKSDQSTGDPRAFYEMHGYTNDAGERVGKNKNIDILSKPTEQATIVT